MISAALALAACGGDDDEASTNSSPSPTPGNDAPTISGTPLSSIMPGSTYDFLPTSDDVDGDPLTFTIENLPAWATFDADTGRLQGTPAQGDLGTYSGIRISVSDGQTTASLAAFAVDVVATGSGSATLTWTAPTQKTDGSPLTDLAGYKIYWGTSPGNYTKSAPVDPGLTTYVVDGLTPATWYFAATALDSQGIESQYSNEASKEVF